MPKDPIQNKELQTLLHYQIIVAQNGRSYTVNNRKNGDLSRVHAHSPQLMAAKLPHGSALYFISCDFKGDPMKYTDNKFEAVKAYLDVLGVDYRVVLCDTLPRHNWKHILRTKNIDLARYDEILTECKSDGKKAADLFYQEAEKADPRLNRLTEEELEKFVYKITQNANQHRVEQCQKIFSRDKVILWSDYYHNLSVLTDEYQVALKACYKQCAEGARKREGNVVDNIVYKQEELAIGLHISNSMAQQPATGFYNEFSKQSDHTAHMIACKDFGHFEVLDIFYDLEHKITQALLDLELIKNEMKANDPEKQLAQCVRLFPTMQPSLQKEFVLELLEQSKMRVPSQLGFINSCLKLYKTLPSSLQMPFLSALLEHPKKKIAAYFKYLDTFDSVSERKEYILGYDTRVAYRDIQPSFEPVALFRLLEKIMKMMRESFSWRSAFWRGHTFIHMVSGSPYRTGITLDSSSQNSATLLEIAIDAGASIEAIDDLGRTPLYNAIDKRSIINIKTLLKAGATIDERLQAGTQAVQLEYLKTQPQTKEVKEIISTVENALAQQKSQRKNKI